MTERTTEELSEIATAITRTIYEMAEAFDITRPDLAAAMIVATGNVGFAAWQGGIVEHLRDAADLFERQLLAENL